MNNPRYQLYQCILERESAKLITQWIVMPNKVLSEVLLHINLVLLMWSHYERARFDQFSTFNSRNRSKSLVLTVTTIRPLP